MSFIQQPCDSSQHSQEYVEGSLQVKMRKFWDDQMDIIQEKDIDMKNHELPLARIKKIMKADQEIKQMISSEVPMLFSKVCELFLLNLTSRAWFDCESTGRRTLQRSDIINAVNGYEMFDFLIDIVPREEVREEHDQINTMQNPLPHNTNINVIPQEQQPMSYANDPNQLQYINMPIMQHQGQLASQVDVPVPPLPGTVGAHDGEPPQKRNRIMQ